MVVAEQPASTSSGNSAAPKMAIFMTIPQVAPLPAPAQLIIKRRPLEQLAFTDASAGTSIRQSITGKTMKRRHIALAAVFAAISITSPVGAWDSAKFKWLTPIIHPTHSYL